MQLTGASYSIGKVKLPPWVPLLSTKSKPFNSILKVLLTTRSRVVVFTTILFNIKLPQKELAIDITLYSEVYQIIDIEVAKWGQASGFGFHRSF